LMPSLGRFGLVTVVAATIAYAITFHSLPEDTASKQGTAILDQDAAAIAENSFANVPAARQATARLVVDGRQAFTNEPIPLGVSLTGSADNEFALLTGLAAGTRLSVGAAMGDTGWRLPARELSSAIAYAPKDFVGVMNAAIDLRTSADTVVDRNVMRLEWISR